MSQQEQIDARLLREIRAEQIEILREIKRRIRIKRPAGRKMRRIGR